jgi:hypothetical protein
VGQDANDAGKKQRQTQMSPASRLRFVAITPGFEVVSLKSKALESVVDRQRLTGAKIQSAFSEWWIIGFHLSLF